MEWLTGDATRREFERFVGENSSALLKTAYLITWSLPESEDLVQEAFLRAAQRWPQIRRMEFPRAYVSRTLVNLALRHRGAGSDGLSRRKNVDNDEIDRREDVRQQGDLAMIDTRSEIVWLLGALSRKQRTVIVLRYFEDLSEREIAEYLSWPVGTVKSTTSRAIERLQTRAHRSPPSDLSHATHQTSP
jgi:RNA polymerase sigma-70 factor (sigma-E family)